jgi:hypothetical protein
MQICLKGQNCIQYLSVHRLLKADTLPGILLLYALDLTTSPAGIKYTDVPPLIDPDHGGSYLICTKPWFYNNLFMGHFPHMGHFPEGQHYLSAAGENCDFVLVLISKPFNRF